MQPYVSVISPALEMATPAKSTRGRSALRDSGIRIATAIRATTTTGTLIRNTDPHQKWSSSAPPTRGPIGKLRKIVEAITAVAFCRSSGANSTGMMASASGMIAAAPRPSTARAAISSPEVTAYAQAAELTPKVASPVISTRLRPQRSPSIPAGSTAAASTRLYASLNHCRSLVDACSALAMLGSARFSTVRSSPTTSTLMATATSASHRRAPVVIMIVTSFR